MSFDVDLPDGGEHIEVEAAADGVYITVAVYDDCWQLLEEHTYADGPHAPEESDR